MTYIRHILNTAEFNVRISVWSLCSTSGIVAALRAPKHTCHGIDASSDGKFLAVAERDNCKDYIQVYRCSNWTPIRRFAVDTKDLADLKWAPDDSAIAVWDSVRVDAHQLPRKHAFVTSSTPPLDAWFHVSRTAEPLLHQLSSAAAVLDRGVTTLATHNAQPHPVFVCT